MADSSLFGRLKRLFSTDVLIRNVGGHQLKVIDTARIQSDGNINTNRRIDRFTRIFSTNSSGFSHYAGQLQLYTRLELFRDYEAMDSDSIIASALDIYADECLHGETVIPLLNGQKHTIKQLYESGARDFWLYGLDGDNTFKPVKADRVAYNGKKKVYAITLDDGTVLRCTSNHIWITPDGKEILTSELQVGGAILALSTKKSTALQAKQGHRILRAAGYKSTMELATSSNHRIVSICEEGLADVYDIVNVGDNHIFAIEAIDGSKLYTHNCSVQNEFGDVISISTTNEKVHKVLHNLFYDVLNIEFNLWPWIRNTLKYGDFFLKLNVAEKFGVIGVEPISAYEMIREENYDPEHPQKIRFRRDPTALSSKYSTQGGSHDETVYDNYEIAHFRLLTDTNFLPYGRSIVEPARKVWKQLCLAKDTPIWTPQGYKVVQDVKIGDQVLYFNIKTKQVEATVVKNTAKTGHKPVFEVKTGHRTLLATEEHPVLTVDGSYKPIHDLELGEQIVIAGNVNTNKAEIPELSLPTKDLVARFSSEYFATRVLAKQGLCLADNTKQVRLTGNYLKAVCGLTFVEYCKKHDIPQNYANLLNRNNRISLLDACRVCRAFDLDPSQLQISHFAGKGLYVDPTTLKDNFASFVRFYGFMLGDGWLDNNCVKFSIGSRVDKSQRYVDFAKSLGTAIYIKNPDTTKAELHILSGYLTKLFEQLGFKTGVQNKTIPSWAYQLSQEHAKELLLGFADADGCQTTNTRYQVGSINKALVEQLVLLAQQTGLTTTNVVKQTPKNNTSFWGGRANSYYYFAFDLKDSPLTQNVGSMLVERVRSITPAGEADVYDIEVESDDHNFIAAGIVVHNCLMEDAMLIHRIMRAPDKRLFKIDIGNIPPNEIDAFMELTIAKMKKVPYVDPQTGDYNLKYNMQNILEDFYFPVRGSESATTVENISGLQSEAIQDIEYLRDRMLASLKIPKAYIGYEQDTAGKGNLASQDFRFARTIERIQRIIVSELYKIAIVHLYSQDFSDEDLVDFTLELTAPSTIYEKEKVELWQSKASLAGDLIEKKLFSRYWIYREVWNMHEEEYLEEQNRLVQDAKDQFRLEQIKNEGNDPVQTGQSFGTPHDIATLYKGNAGVPNGYDERMYADRTASMPKGGWPGAGRPKEPGTYGTHKHPLGWDPLGVKVSHHIREDVGIRGRHRDLIEQLESEKKKRALTKTLQQVEVVEDQTLLSEDNLLQEE